MVEYQGLGIGSEEQKQQGHIIVQKPGVEVQGREGQLSM